MFKVGDVVQPANTAEFRGYWKEYPRKNGNFNASHFTVSHVNDSMVKLKEISFDGGAWFIEEWFEKYSGSTDSFKPTGATVLVLTDGKGNADKVDGSADGGVAVDDGEPVDGADSNALTDADGDSDDSDGNPTDSKDGDDPKDGDSKGDKKSDKDSNKDSDKGDKKSDKKSKDSKGKDNMPKPDEIVKVKDMPLGRIGAFTGKPEGYLYIAKSSFAYIKFWPGTVDSNGKPLSDVKAQMEQLTGSLINDWEVKLLPEGTTLTFNFNGEKGWAK